MSTKDTPIDWVCGVVHTTDIRGVVAVGQLHDNRRRCGYRIIAAGRNHFSELSPPLHPPGRSPPPRPTQRQRCGARGAPMGYIKLCYVYTYLPCQGLGSYFEGIRPRFLFELHLFMATPVWWGRLFSQNKFAQRIFSLRLLNAWFNPLRLLTVLLI